MATGRTDVFGLGWRMIFLVDLPVGVLTLVAAAILVPKSRAADVRGFDPLGVGLLTLGLLLVLYPLVEGRTAGWPLWTFGVLGSVFFGPLPGGFGPAAQVTLSVDIGVYLLAATLPTARHSRHVGQ
jgi:hypothetical protein